MLSRDYLDNVADVLSDIYAELEMQVIFEMAKAIEKTLKAKNFNAMRIKQRDELYKTIIRLTQGIAYKSGVEVNKTVKNAAIKSYAFDSNIYQAAGITAGKLLDQPYLAQILAAGIERTNGSLLNFTGTMATNVTKSYLQTVDLAYMEITTGATDYNSAIKKAVKRIASEGVTTVWFDGRTNHLDTAVRRAVLTGVNQTALQITDATGDELGSYLIQTSAHWGAREGEGYKGHVNWQGKVFSKRPSSKYKDFRTSTGYGKVDGLGGANCRHSFFPYFEVVSVDIPKLPPKPDVIFKGKTYSFYEATQRQRAIERNIRRWKREQKAIDTVNLDSTYEKNKVLAWQKEAREFTKATGVLRRYDLESIAY